MEITQERKIIKQQIDKVSEEKGIKVPSKVYQMLEEAVYKIKTEDLPLKEILQFSPELMEKFYAHGYRLFKSGKYEDALKVFYLLRLLDALEMRYTFAIAACHHYLHQYSEAAAYYILCKYIQQNPLACLHLYNCYLKLGESLGALKAIIECIQLCGDSPQLSSVKKIAQLEYESLKKTLPEYLKENFSQFAA